MSAFSCVHKWFSFLFLFYLWAADRGIFRLECFGAEIKNPAKIVGEMRGESGWGRGREGRK